MRGEGYEPDTRCGTLGTRGHATPKSSLPGGACFINPASRHRRYDGLPREASQGPWEVAGDGNWLREEGSSLTAGEESAEGIIGAPRAY